MSQQFSYVNIGNYKTTGIKINSELKYIKCSDEHGIITDPYNILKINDKIRLIPGHCDPTCNLHDWYVVVKDTKVIDLWPVSARGFSF